MPAPATKGEDGDRLSAKDEAILDKVAARRTPEQIAASKRWYAEIDRKNAEAQAKAKQQKGTE